jgi:hypothetical protein
VRKGALEQIFDQNNLEHPVVQRPDWSGVTTLARLLVRLRLHVLIVIKGKSSPAGRFPFRVESSNTDGMNFGLQ